MSEVKNLPADEALRKLKDGNEKYMTAVHGTGDISPARREALTEGQSPYAVVLACSDSRVVPEEIFQVGLGEIFVTRVAGNVTGDQVLGSIEYAIEHLGTNLIVVLGHEGCGAIEAAIGGSVEGFVTYLTTEVKKAIGMETDPVKASKTNALHERERIIYNLDLEPEGPVKVEAAYYHLKDGRVEWL